ncbi:MAG: hypothetical protein V1708_00525 [Candidatus Micrarchaeota archaeon]
MPLEKEVPYALTMEGELEKGLVLEKGETVLARARGFLYSSWYKLPSLLAVTDRRLVILKHRVIGSDKIVTILLSELESVEVGTHAIFLGPQQSVLFLKAKNASVIRLGLTGDSFFDLSNIMKNTIRFALTPSAAGSRIAAEPRKSLNIQFSDLICRLSGVKPIAKG